MSLSYNDQLNLMQDILTNHLEDCCGSVSECEQLGRLVKSLMTNQEIHPDFHPVLEKIYMYCQAGKNSSDLDRHINAHQDSISQWVNQISSL